MKATRHFHPGPIGPSLLALTLALAISQAHPAHGAVIAASAGAPADNAAAAPGRALAVATSTGASGVLVSSRVATSTTGQDAAVIGASMVNAGGNATGPYRLGNGPARRSGTAAVYSSASVMPDAVSARRMLATAPTVAAALAGDRVAAAGTMEAYAWRLPVAGGYRYHVATDFEFDTTGKHLLTLGLPRALALDGGFGMLELSLSNHGTELFSQTFHSLAEARPFFSDHAQAIGLLDAGRQDLLLTADFVLDGPGGFGFQYVLATAVPEPETWMSLVFGLGMVLVAARRPAHAGGRRFAEGEGRLPQRVNFTAFA